MSTSRRSASISSARVGVVSMPVLTHGRTKHASGISALRKRTRYLWLFGLTADHYGVVGSYTRPHSGGPVLYNDKQQGVQPFIPKPCRQAGRDRPQSDVRRYRRPGAAVF